MHPDQSQYGTILSMPTNLHIREVPDAVHSALVARAERRGMSLRQYTIQVLEDHCALPALDDWLDGLAALPPVDGAPAAEAVRRARDEDDREVLRGRGGA